MKMPRLDTLPGPAQILGEGAIWHARAQRLYWVDIAGHAAHAFEPASDRLLTAPLGQSAGTIVPTGRAEVLIALQRGFAFLDFAHGRLTPFPVEPLLPADHRFNDGKCDASGRLWVGSMAQDATPEAGRLWCLHPTLRAESRRERLTIPNGIAWSRDGCTCYHIDSPTRRVQAFTFDPVDGGLSAGRTLREFTPAEGYPDGMTIDAQGHLWIALWDGWKVVRIDAATGATLAEIKLPVQRPTACAFGGPKLDTLYITSARIDLTESELAEQSLAGHVFVAHPGTTGVPAHEFAG